MLKAIFWKEWRQQGPFLIAILILMPISVGLFLWLGGSFPSERIPISDKLTMLALGIAILQAMVTGSVLFAGEVETGTLDFLDACSAERSRIWVAKMAAALAIVLPAALLPALFGGLHGLLWMVYALETLLVAAACSVFVRTPFRALGAALLCLIGIGIVLSVMMIAAALVITVPTMLLRPRFGDPQRFKWMVFAVETLLVAAACSVFVRTPFRALGAAVLCLFVMSGLAYLTSESAVGTCGLSLVIAGFVVFASWLRFCRADRERQADAARTLLVHLPSTWLTGTLWFLVRRQWRMLLLVGFVLVVCLGWILTTNQLWMLQGVACAPAILFAVGCMFGWSVFALEQAGAERFLGDQRFPRNRLWLAKVGGWLLPTVIAVTVVAFFTVIIVFETGTDNIFNDWAMQMFARELALGLLGFSAGQFFGIHHRRLPVAIFLTLLIATPIGAAWYAPLFGGEPAWHFAVVPLLFLAASRFEMRRWTTGRLDGVAHWVRCGIVVLGGFALTGLILWHRTEEVPDVGAPFVVTDSPIETPIEQERTKRLAGPANEASRRFGYLKPGPDDNYYSSQLDFAHWHEPGVELDSGAWIELRTCFDQVLLLGAPDDGRPEFAKLVAEAFAGDWSTSLRRELAHESRRVPILGSPENHRVAFMLDSAAKLFYLRSALLVAEGKSDAALDEFAMSLAIVRHQILFGGDGGSYGVYHGRWMENRMLEATETLLRRDGSDAAFCRGLLALLNRHARELPSLSDMIKASYAAANPRLPQWTKNRGLFERPAAFLFDAPLESMRDDRLQRAFCRGLLEAAKQKPLFLHPRTLEDWKNRTRLWADRYLVLAMPDRSADDWARILSHQTFDDKVPLFGLFENEMEPLAKSAAHLTALRLACAAALYRHDHGRDLGSLDELAPEYFPTLPPSPFAECPFVLRRSEGETWKLVHDGLETAILRTIAPGTQVIEMPGLPELKIAVPRIR